MQTTFATLLTVGVGTGLLLPRPLAAVFEWPATAGGNGHLYEVVGAPGGVTWDAAKAAAEFRGGYLATLTSEAENTFVFGLAAASAFWVQPYLPQISTSYGPWLGGFQPLGSAEPAGGWSWLHSDGPLVFTQWEDGEPNEFEGVGENALMFLSLDLPFDRTWNDQPAGTPWVRSYVVEFDARSIPEPSAWFATAGLSVLGVALRRRGRACACGWGIRRKDVAG